MKLVPVLAVFLIAAIGVKFVAAIPAKSFGMSWNQVGILGALFNTRGLLVLVAGLIGIQLEIITPATFTIIVVVALVTNLMTLPLLRYFYAREPKGKPPAPDQLTETALELPPTGG
jgi:K+:H+ antiporter